MDKKGWILAFKVKGPRTSDESTTDCDSLDDCKSKLANADQKFAEIGMIVIFAKAIGPNDAEEVLRDIKLSEDSANMNQGKEDLITQITEEYKQRRLQREKPDLQVYLDAYPEVAQEVKADIEAWEWLHELAGTWEFLASFPSVEETLAAIRPRLVDDWKNPQSAECLDTKTLGEVIRKGKSQLSDEEKVHLSECESCRERLVDLLLRLAAFKDNYIWDEKDLEPVPEEVMQKMRDAAQKWCAEKDAPQELLQGKENEPRNSCQVPRCTQGIKNILKDWIDSSKFRSSDCFSFVQLHKFIEGSCEATELLSILKHLSSCTYCRNLLFKFHVTWTEKPIKNAIDVEN